MIIIQASLFSLTLLTSVAHIRCQTSNIDINGSHTEQSTLFEASSDSMESLRPQLIDPELAKILIQRAPQRVKILLESLKKPDVYKASKRSAIIFVGTPGTGKTSLAQAIAQESNSKCIMIGAPFLLDQYKNSGPQNIKALFAEISRTREQIVVIIDEFNHLTQKESNHNDPDKGTAAALWLALDECRKNPNVCIIGTTNDATKMPDALKSRLAANIIEIKLDNPKAQRREVLMHYLKQRPHDCDNKCLGKMDRIIDGFEPRKIEEMIENASLCATYRDPEGKRIKEVDLETAIQWNNDGSKSAEDKKEISYMKYVKNTQVGIGMISGAIYVCKESYPILKEGFKIIRDYIKGVI